MQIDDKGPGWLRVAQDQSGGVRVKSARCDTEILGGIKGRQVTENCRQVPMIARSLFPPPDDYDRDREGGKGPKMMGKRRTVWEELPTFLSSESAMEP